LRTELGGRLSGHTGEQRRDELRDDDAELMMFEPLAIGD
jgi:hypothetical protein